MEKRGINKTKSFKLITALLLLLFIAFFSSCSYETPQLCNISINLNNNRSRSLTATIDPLNNYTVYYKSIYKGSDSQAYNNMSSSDSFNRLTSSGILVSQGLWEIQAIFKPTKVDEPNTYIPTKGDVIATSGDIFINLNTTSITVRFS